MAALVDTAVKYFTDGNSPSDFSVDEFLRALETTPLLAVELYRALANRPIHFRNRLFRIVRNAYAPAALPLLRGMQDLPQWTDVVLAVDAGGELVDELIARLPTVDVASEPHLPAIAAYYGGSRARAALSPTLDVAQDIVALGIALIGDPADLDWMKTLSSAGHGISAKRVHGALAKPKLRDRLAALDAIPKSMGHLGTLLALCKLIADSEPPIVERAAVHLRSFVVTQRVIASPLIHATFLRRARAAIADGVTQLARDALDEIQATIPRSVPFPQGPPPKKASQVIAARAAVAEKRILGAKLRGLEMLDTLRDQLAVKPATARNLALEAQIAEDPNDVAHYLVYADWLQTQNDARGLLITLQHAAGETPADNARAIAATAYLHEHRYSLLGRLEPFVREGDRTSVELEWFMGFIKRARIAGQTTQILDVVTYLLETPSATFLQELVVESRGGPLAVDPNRIVEILLETKQPQTLARLAIGKPGSWTMPAALNAAFPRLARDPAIVWAEAMAGAAAQNKLKLDIDPARLPLLVPRDQRIPVDMSLVLLGLKAELDKQRPLGVLLAMPQVFAREVLDGFALALAEQWEAIGETPRWPFDAIGPLGGEQCVAYLGRRLEAWSHQRAVQGIEHLVRIGTDDAICELITIALGHRGLRARRQMASSALDILSKRRGLPDRDALLVRVCPRKSNAQVLATQRAWLESLMLTGVRIPAADFERHVANNPLRRPLASTLLWAECTGERVGHPFRIGDGYQPQHEVGLVHPAEVVPEELAALRRAFASTHQVILQLERPVFYLAAETAKLTKLTRFAKRRVGFSALESTLLQRGWTSESDEDMHATAGWTKYFPRDNASAFAKLSDEVSSIAEVEVAHHRHARRFADLHVVTISELLWDLETAHGGAANPAHVPAKAPPIVVERAKSGRAKCIVCTNAIAKGASRIGIERMIETPSFTGRGTVWLHPECAPSVPELAGVDVGALLQDV